MSLHPISATSLATGPTVAPLLSPAEQPRPHLRAVETELSSPPTVSIGEPVVQVQRPGLPSLPLRLIGTIAIFAFEAVEGTRHVGQLGKWITADVSAHLATYRSLIAQRKSLYRDTRRLVPTVRKVRAMSPAPRVVEASVILDADGRARAVALRFEYNRARWQATSVTVL